MSPRRKKKSLTSKISGLVSTLGSRKGKLGKLFIPPRSGRLYRASSRRGGRGKW